MQGGDQGAQLVRVLDVAAEEYHRAGAQAVERASAVPASSVGPGMPTAITRPASSCRLRHAAALPDPPAARSRRRRAS